MGHVCKCLKFKTDDSEKDRFENNWNKTWRKTSYKYCTLNFYCVFNNNTPQWWLPTEFRLGPSDTSFISVTYEVFQCPLARPNQWPTPNRWPFINLFFRGKDKAVVRTFPHVFARRVRPPVTKRIPPRILCYYSSIVGPSRVSHFFHKYFNLNTVGLTTLSRPDRV